jgi:bifunctional non-homologous end joining protein LigD
MLANKNFDSLPAEARKRVRPAKQPPWLPPMLATLTDKPFFRQGWLFEPKLDGERCLVFRRPASLELYSRNQKLLNSKYAELLEPFRRQQTGSFVLDGEIVAFESGVTSFAKLQQRMQIEHPSGELRRRVPVWFYAFDLLYLDGYRRGLLLRSRQAGLRRQSRDGLHGSYTASAVAAACRTGNLRGSVRRGWPAAFRSSLGKAGINSSGRIH